MLFIYYCSWGFRGKNTGVVCHFLLQWETQVQSLGGEDLLEKEMTTHSNILAWKIPWTKSLVGYSPWSRKESDATERLHFHFTFRQWATCVRTLHYEESWVALHRMAHSFIELCKPLCHDKAVIHDNVNK